MAHSSYALLAEQDRDTATMKALVFYGPGNIHSFSLDRITEAYRLFGERREGVIKVAIKP